MGQRRKDRRPSRSSREEKRVSRKIMEKSASFPAYSVGTTLSAQCYLGIEPLLQRAASTGDAELLLTLLKNGVSPNFQFEDNLGPLHLAAKNGNTQCAFYLLQFNANPNMVSKRGVTPLHLACRHGHTQVVRLLVDHGGDVNLPSRGGVCSLHLAARCGHSHVVELLLDKGSTVDARTHAGLTALHLASECGHTSVVCALLDHHRGPSIYNSKASIDTLESASSKDKSLDVNSWTTVEHFTALHVAAHSGHTDLIEMLLSKYRADVDHRSKHGCTPLHLAALKGYQKCAESLVRYGADTEAKTSAGFAPLHLAVLQMTTEAVNFLLRLEVDPNVRDHQGRTPLHLIIEGPFSEALGGGGSSNQSSPGVVGGHCCRTMCPHDRYVYLSSWCSEPQTDNDKAKMVELLIKNGADPNAIDSRGKTPLHLASTVRSVEVARVLLHNGADPNICDEKNEATALHIICMDGHVSEESLELCHPLIDSAAKMDAPDIDGHTPLHFCCLNGLTDMAKVLMNRGANVETRSGLGYTPLHVTAHYDRVGVAKLLLEAGVNPDEEDFQVRLKKTRLWT